MELSEWLGAGDLPSHLLLGQPSDAPEVHPPADVHVYIPIHYLDDGSPAGSVQAIWYPNRVDAERFIENESGENVQAFGDEGYYGQEGTFIEQDEDGLFMLKMSRSSTDETEFVLEIAAVWVCESRGAVVIRIELINKDQYISPLGLFEWAVDYLYSLGGMGIPEQHAFT
jgi:hypothetical protein